MEMPDVLKKGVWKFNIVQNNYSKCWASPVCWTLESLQLLNWAIHRFKLYLKWWCWQFGTIVNLALLYFSIIPYIQSASHTHQILLVSTVLDFFTPNFKATVISTFIVHLLWKFTKWLKICWENVVCSFVEFLRTVSRVCLTKSCATFFGPLDIHVIQDKFRSTWVLQNFFCCCLSHAHPLMFVDFQSVPVMLL